MLWRWECRTCDVAGRTPMNEPLRCWSCNDVVTTEVTHTVPDGYTGVPLSDTEERFDRALY